MTISNALHETLTEFDDAGVGTPLTTPEIATRLDLGRRSTYNRLEKLAEASLIETKKVGANARVWWLPPSDEDRSDCGAQPTEAASLVGEAFDTVDAGVFVFDADGEVAWINRTAEQQFGLDREAVMGLEKRRLVHSRIGPAVDHSDAFVETVLSTDDGTDQFVCHVEGDSNRQQCLEHRSEPIESGAFAGGSVDFYFEITSREGNQEITSVGASPGAHRAQFRSLVEGVEEYAIFLLDVDGHVQTWNSGAERIKGYDRAAILGEHFSTFYTDEDRASGVPERNLAVATRRGSIEDEGWRVRADGSQFWANVTITAIRDDEGELMGYAKVTRDMTDRREQEQLLRRERDLNERLLEIAPVRLAVFEPDGTVDRINPRGRRQTGLSPGDSIGDGQTELQLYDVDGDPIDPDEHPVLQVIETEEDVQEWLARHEGEHGEDRWVSVTATPLFDEDDNIERVVAAGNDVTELKRQKRQLAHRHEELEQELDEVYRRIDDGVIGIDDQFRFTYVNESGAEMLERDREELVGTQFVDVFPDVAAQLSDEIVDATHSGRSRTFETHHETLDAWFAVSVYPAESGLSVYFRDITARRERERELALYETIVETIEDGVYVLDEEYRFTFVNDTYAEMTGYDREELLGNHYSFVFPDDASRGPSGHLEEIIADERASANLETDIQRADGTTLPVESRFTSFPDKGYQDPRTVGVVRDISERAERENELKTRVRQQAVVTDLAQRALEARDPDAVMDETARLVADTLGTDYCKVLDLDADAEELLLRQGVGWQEGIVGEATVSSIEADSQAAYTLASETPVVVEDLDTETRFSGPDLLTSHDVRSGISTIIGPFEDPWGILGTHDTSVREFSEHDVNFVQSVASILASAIARQSRESVLRQQREHLVALNDLNDVVRDITDAVIEQSTRGEIEKTVCERLAATDSYLFAWIGAVDAATETVRVRSEAGVEGYLENITISVDPDDPYSSGPTGQAVLTESTQIAHNVSDGTTHAPWQDQVDASEFRSSAAIPIVHDETLYGVLNVYAPRPQAFGDQERAVIEQLGEVIGHAIANVERKAALTSDQVVEVEVAINDVFDSLDIDVDPTDRITFDQILAVEDGRHLAFGTVSENSVESLDRIQSTVPHFEDVTVFEGHDGECRFKLVLSEPPVVSAVAAANGYVHQAVIEEGDYRMTIHLPPSVDRCRLVDTVQETYPEARMVSQRHISREQDAVKRVDHTATEELTDRQRSVLRVAHLSGYFDWPREHTGKEVADSLGVSPPTFHRHLRNAQEVIFGQLIAEESVY